MLINHVFINRLANIKVNFNNNSEVRRNKKKLTVVKRGREREIVKGLYDL